ncbi:MAG: hypothetical protein QOJ89_4552 [bacterium]|jgi:hypothetical protein
MPTLPMIVFGGLMAIGIAAVTVLVARLTSHEARRPRASRPLEPTIEDELQAIIDARAQAPRSR